MVLFYMMLEGEKNIHKKRGLNCVCERLLLFFKLVSEPKMSSSDSDPSNSLTSEFVGQWNVNAGVNKETHNIS